MLNFNLTTPSGRSAYCVRAICFTPPPGGDAAATVRRLGDPCEQGYTASDPPACIMRGTFFLCSRHKEAQMAQQPRPVSPTLNPLIQDLLAEGGGKVLMIGGFVGQTRDDHIRLYADLSLRCRGCGAQSNATGTAAQQTGGGGGGMPSLCEMNCLSDAANCLTTGGGPNAPSWRKLWCVIGYLGCRFACWWDDMSPHPV